MGSCEVMERIFVWDLNAKAEWPWELFRSHNNLSLNHNSTTDLGKLLNTKSFQFPVHKCTASYILLKVRCVESHKMYLLCIVFMFAFFLFWFVKFLISKTCTWFKCLKNYIISMLWEAKECSPPCPSHTPKEVHVLIPRDCEDDPYMEKGTLHMWLRILI